MADTAFLNIINSSRVLRVLWQNRGISRIEIAAILELDRSTITKIVNILMKKNIVVSHESAGEQTGSGRRRSGLAINTKLGLVAGIELQTNEIHGLLMTIDGEIMQTIDDNFDPTIQSIEDAIEKCFSRLNMCCKDIGMTLLGCGIGLSGIIDPYSGQILRSNPLQIFEPLDMGKVLEKKFGIPFVVENDANCCCWAEMTFSKAERERNFLAVLGEIRHTDIHTRRIPGLAIGLGFVIRGKVLHGDDFTAGEFKSIMWKDGNSTQFSFSDEEMAHIQDNKELRKRLIEELGQNIALLVNCMNMTKVVFSGDITRFENEIVPVFDSQIRRNWLYQDSRPIVVDFSRYGAGSVCYGAGSFFVERLFTIPGVGKTNETEVGMVLLNKINQLVGLWDYD